MGSFFAFSFYFLKFQGERYANDNEKQKYDKISFVFNHIISQQLDLETIQNYLKEMGFIQINDNRLKSMILESSNIPRNAPGIFFRSIELNKDIFILLVSQDEVFLYKDSMKSFYVNYYIVILMGSAILILLFVMVMRSLLPMIHLRRQIRKFAKGDLQVDCRIPQKDEIGELANEFYKATNRIDALNKSRTLFLRSIMHELKTPITKGRITAEMVKNKTQRERLISVFYRLNSLIDEFAKIEQLSSKSYNLHKSEFLLQDLIIYVEKMLLIDKLEKSPITCTTPNDLIKADFELFAMSVKNLIDNAIKYSKDGKVSVESDGHNLIISNLGEALKMDIEEYYKPYFKDSIKPNSQGFGLGMYIIKNTLDAQNFGLSYAHVAGVNHFTIENCIIERSCPLPPYDKPAQNNKLMQDDKISRDSQPVRDNKPAQDNRLSEESEHPHPARQNQNKEVSESKQDFQRDFRQDSKQDSKQDSRQDFKKDSAPKLAPKIKKSTRESKKDTTNKTTKTKPESSKQKSKSTQQKSTRARSASQHTSQQRR